MALTVSAPLPAQRGDVHEASTRVSDLLRALYPELSTEGWTFNVAAAQWPPSAVLRAPLVELTMTVTRSSKPNSGEENVPILKARVEFTAFGELGTLTVDGEYVNAKKSWDLEMLAEDDRNASDEAVAARLRSMGARFGVGTDREMREHVLAQLHRLEKVLGPIELRDLGLLENGTVWSGEIVVTSPQGRRTYGALFEPFEGRLRFLMGLNG